MAESKNNTIQTIISKVNEATAEMRTQLFELECEQEFDSFSERSKLYFTIQKVQLEALIEFLKKDEEITFKKDCINLINGFKQNIGSKGCNNYDRFSMLLSKIYASEGIKKSRTILKLIKECKKMVKFCNYEIERQDEKAKASQFIKTRIHEIVGQFYKEEEEVDDNQVSNFLKLIEERIQEMLEEILDEYEPDYENVYTDDRRLGSMIMEEYDNLMDWIELGFDKYYILHFILDSQYKIWF